MGIKKFFGSKKGIGLLVGLLTTVLNAYLFKDNPELAHDTALIIGGIVSAYLLGQGISDGFGGESYHGATKEKKD